MHKKREGQNLVSLSSAVRFLVGLLIDMKVVGEQISDLVQL